MYIYCEPQISESWSDCDFAAVISWQYLGSSCGAILASNEGSSKSREVENQEGQSSSREQKVL